MNARAFDLTFKAPLTDLPSAPGLFGHLAWWKRYTGGDDAVADFLRAFLVDPPWRLSSAFPKGRLPRPWLKPAADPALAESAKRKALKRLRYLDFAAFSDVINSGESNLIDDTRLKEADIKFVENVSRTRVGIDRAHGGAHAGILYTDVLVQPIGIWTVYATASEDAALNDLFEGLKFVGQQGYGGKISVGLGRFEVSEPRQVALPEAQSPDGYTTLSPCLPRGWGYYQLESQWGRLGGTFTHQERPFKRPYLRAKVGSSFFGTDGGQGLLETARIGTATVYDYLYAFPLGVRLGDGHAAAS